MTPIRKEIMEEFKKLWRKEIKLAGHDNTNPLYKLTNGLGAFESFLSQALTRIEEAITYDNISIGWDHDCHYRYVFAIQNGQIIYKERVSDDSISHLDVVRQIDIENYVKSKLSSQEEKISFEEGEKIVKKIQQKVESYRATPRYDQGGYHPSEDSVLACVCHCHNNVTHFPGGCMFCSCIHCKPSPEEWEGLLSIIFYKDEDGDRYIKDSIALSDLHEWYDKTISAQKERIRKDIGGMREEDKFGQDEASPLGENALRNWGYNRALDDVLDLLEGDSK